MTTGGITAVTAGGMTGGLPIGGRLVVRILLRGTVGANVTCLGVGRIVDFGKVGGEVYVGCVGNTVVGGAV